MCATVLSAEFRPPPIPVAKEIPVIMREEPPAPDVIFGQKRQQAAGINASLEKLSAQNPGANLDPERRQLSQLTDELDKLTAATQKQPQVDGKPTNAANHEVTETMTREEISRIMLGWNHDKQRNPIFEAAEEWIKYGSAESKKNLIRLIEYYPDIAKEIERVSQALLRQEYGPYGLIDKAGRIRLYRGVNADSLSQLHFFPYDSFTYLNMPPAMNEKHEHSFVVGLELPVANVWSWYAVLSGHMAEQEFISNHLGVGNARVFSVNGHPPSAKELSALKIANPTLDINRKLRRSKPVQK